MANLLFGSLAAIGAATWLELRRRFMSLLPARKPEQILAGAATMIVGAFIMLMVVGNPGSMSEGVSPWVGIAAGGVFFLFGLVMTGDARGWFAGDGLVHRLLVAMLVSLFAAVAMIFPPGAMFVVPIAVVAWMTVYRSIHQRVTGRDPLATVSHEKQLGIGCLVTVVLVLALILALRYRAEVGPPPEGLPLERVP